MIREARADAGQLLDRAPARAGAENVARAALAPTVDTLQQSAFGLLDRMLPRVSLAAYVNHDSGLTSLNLCSHGTLEPCCVDVDECIHR